MHDMDYSAPLIVALTRRASLMGIPYNIFIGLLVSSCVLFMWTHSLVITTGVALAGFVWAGRLCRRDLWAVEIFFTRLQRLSVYPVSLRQYFGQRSYQAE